MADSKSIEKEIVKKRDQMQHALHDLKKAENADS